MADGKLFMVSYLLKQKLHQANDEKSQMLKKEVGLTQEETDRVRYLEAAILNIKLQLHYYPSL